MTDANPTRPDYIDGQFLDADDFTSEQLYHLSMLRRHHIAHHTSGTVAGLEIGIDGNTGIPYVAPGVGIDAYGRELIVTERLSLGGGLFPVGGPDAYDVVLIYDRFAQDGRWSEQPRVGVVAPTGPGAGPPTPSDAVGAFGATGEPPDDPAQQAPLFVGQLRRPDRAGDPPIIDESGRPYVELNASAVSAVDGTVRIDLAADEGPFALYAGTDPSQLSRRLALAPDGQLTVDNGLTVQGQLTLGGQLTFAPAAQGASAWGVQLVSIPSESVSELRVQMGPASGSQARRTAIGVAGQGGSFKALLTIADDGTVTVNGDMVVNGTVQADGGIVPAELSGQTSQYAAAAMTSGMGAASALIDKVASGSFNPYTGRPATSPITQAVAHLSQDESRVENFVQELKEKGEHLIQPLIDALHRL